MMHIFKKIFFAICVLSSFFLSAQDTLVWNLSNSTDYQYNAQFLSLEKVSSSDTWTTSLQSANSIRANENGFVEYMLQGSLNETKLIGLSSRISTQPATNADYAMLIEDKTLSFMESGTVVEQVSGNLKVNDILKIERQADKILYKKNDQLLREVTTNPNYELKAEVAIKTPGGTIKEPTTNLSRRYSIDNFETIDVNCTKGELGQVFFSLNGVTNERVFAFVKNLTTGELKAAQLYSYTDLRYRAAELETGKYELTVTITPPEIQLTENYVISKRFSINAHAEFESHIGMESIDNNTNPESLINLKKTAESGWGNSGATSDIIASEMEDAYFETVITPYDGDQALGLSRKSVNNNKSDLEYAYLIETSKATIIEKGKVVAILPDLRQAEKLSIERKNSEIIYKRNDIEIRRKEILERKELRAAAILEKKESRVRIIKLKECLAVETPELIQVSETIFPETPESLGSISLNVSGGTPPYSFYWDGVKELQGSSKEFFGSAANFNEISKLSTINELPSGRYNVVIQDAEKHKRTMSFIVGTETKWEEIKDLEISGETILKTNGNGWLSGKASLQGIIEHESEAGFSFSIENLEGELAAGIRAINDNQAAKPNDLEIGIHINANEFFVIANNDKELIQEIKTTDVFSLEEDGFGNVKIKINNKEVKSVPIVMEKKYTTDLLIKEKQKAFIKFRPKKIKFWPNVILKGINHVDCIDGNNGSIEVNIQLNPYINNYSIQWEKDGQNLGTNTTLNNLEIGLYKLTVSFQTTTGYNGSFVRYYSVGTKTLWLNEVKASSTNNNLYKTTGSNYLFDAGASSRNIIEAGNNGSFEFLPDFSSTTIANQYAIAVGLSENDINQDWTSIEYGVALVVNPFQGVGLVYVLNSGTTTFAKYIYNITEPWVIEKSGNLIRYKINGSYLSINSPYSGNANLRADVSLLNLNSGLKNCGGVMSCPPEFDPKNFSYAHLSKEVDGGYYTALSRKIKFIYDEEYAITHDQLSYKVYNDNRELVAEKLFDGSSSVSGSPSLVKEYGYNEFLLDLSTMPAVQANKFYILEVYNDKNEVQYLRIKT